MAIEHLEPYVDSAITALKAGLPSRIASANAAATDFQLPYIDDADYWPGGQPVLVRYPAVEVSAYAGSMDALAVAQAEGDADARIAVVCWAQMWPEIGADFSKLYRATLRYGKAMLDVLLQPDAFGDGVVVDRAEYRYAANPAPNERELREMTAASILFFTIDDVEART